MDIFKTILEFYGEIMPRAKKTTTTKTKNTAPIETVKASDVATLAVNLLEVYKAKCKNALVESSTLTREQMAEVAELLDIQHTVVQPQVFDQVSIIFQK